MTKEPPQPLLTKEGNIKEKKFSFSLLRRRCPKGG